MDGERECPVCYEVDQIIDGPSNSDMETSCPHYLCIYCWEEIYQCHTEEDFPAKCPLCRIDVSDWLTSHYSLNDCSEED
jgi:hypothetical protein